MPCVTFEPSGMVVDVERGTSLLEAAALAGETEVQCCGITPACGKCRALIWEGEANLSAPDALEVSKRAKLHFLPGERFGCMARVNGDVTVEWTP